MKLFYLFLILHKLYILTLTIKLNIKKSSKYIRADPIFVGDSYVNEVQSLVGSTYSNLYLGNTFINGLLSNLILSTEKYISREKTDPIITKLLHDVENKNNLQKESYNMFNNNLKNHSINSNNTLDLNSNNTHLPNKTELLYSIDYFNKNCNDENLGSFFVKSLYERESTTHNYTINYNSTNINNNSNTTNSNISNSFLNETLNNSTVNNTFGKI